MLRQLVIFSGKDRELMAEAFRAFVRHAELSNIDEFPKGLDFARFRRRLEKAVIALVPPPPRPDARLRWHRRRIERRAAK